MKTSAFRGGYNKGEMNMGLFDIFKKKPAAAPVIGACAAGKVVAMADIPDEVFSQGILGPCVGIEPVDGNVYAPCDGTISQLTDTLHAIGLTGVLGAEILIHCGVDTVAMNGEGFTNTVKEGQEVKKGDLILTMDLDKVRAAGHPTTIMTIVTNADDYASVETIAEGDIALGADLLKITK